MNNLLTAVRSRLRRPGLPSDGQAAGEKPTGEKPATATATVDDRPRNRFGVWLSRPMTSFHLIIAVASILVTLGLIMVLSASGVYSYDSGGSPWTVFFKQVMWTLVGLVAFYIALRMPIRVMRKLAFPAFAFTIVLLVLVLIPGIGKVANGSRGWFVFGGFSMQPSELAKMAFAIWGAHLLASRRMEQATLRQMLVPLVPAAALALTLIFMQPDLGQSVSLSIILLGLLWYAGLSLKLFVSAVSGAVIAAGVLALSAGYRSARVQSWLNPMADAQGSGYQARQARYALANGGLFGDGLGQGTAKYNYLPNAHNDFIFAIIGEELGYIGAAGVLCLFGLFAYTGMRIARRSADPFLRLLTATVTLWVIGQAFINVGYVVGLLPVTGLQLPLISAGGTSTATTMLILGVITNAARHEPEAVAALRAGRDDRVNRMLRLPPPVPYVPSRLDVARDRLRTRDDKTGGKAVKKAPPRSAGKAITKSAPRSAAKSNPKATPKVSAKPAAKANPKANPKTRSKQPRKAAAADARRTAQPGERAARRAGHHGDGRNGREGRGQQGRARSLEGQRYG